MAKKSGEEAILHVAGIRLRLTGTGNIQMFFHSLDDVRNYTLLPLTMQSVNAVEPTRLGNFRSQRTQLEIKTTEINEKFKIQKLIFFVKTSGLDTPH